jgi:RNA polymerase sigma factor (sigma-70 family)
MSSEPLTPVEAPASSGFQTTLWMVVMAAKGGEGTAAQEALASLCATYWYPLYAYVRRQGFSPHEAEDVTQEFFYRFLQRNPLINVHPDAGRFRSFLLTCLKNFLANEHERAQSQRRAGRHTVISLDSLDAETRYSMEPVDNRSPESVYERGWAFAVLERTMAELERECIRDEKAERFNELQGFLPGCCETISRAELAAKLGVSTGVITMAIYRLRQRFGALLREQVAQTVPSEAEVEEEIRYLISIISRG